MNEGGWGTFQPNRKESAHLKKITKGKVAKKMGLNSNIKKFWEKKN